MKLLAACFVLSLSISFANAYHALFSQELQDNTVIVLLGASGNLATKKLVCTVTGN